MRPRSSTIALGALLEHLAIRNLPRTSALGKCPIVAQRRPPLQPLASRPHPPPVRTARRCWPPRHYLSKARRTNGLVPTVRPSPCTFVSTRERVHVLHLQ